MCSVCFSLCNLFSLDISWWHGALFVLYFSDSIVACSYSAVSMIHSLRVTTVSVSCCNSASEASEPPYYGIGRSRYFPVFMFVYQFLCACTYFIRDVIFEYACVCLLVNYCFRFVQCGTWQSTRESLVIRRELISIKKRMGVRKLEGKCTLVKEQKQIAR